MRTQDHLDVITTTIQKTYGWLDELGEEVGRLTRRQAYHLLRGFLHVLRDRLVVDEAVQLGPQLPILVRGFYYEGWDPSRTPEKLRRTEIVGRFASEAAISDPGSAEEVFRAATRTLLRHVTDGEYADLVVGMPSDAKELFA